MIIFFVSMLLEFIFRFLFPDILTNCIVFQVFASEKIFVFFVLFSSVFDLFRFLEKVFVFLFILYGKMGYMI